MKKKKSSKKTTKKKTNNASLNNKKTINKKSENNKFSKNTLEKKSNKSTIGKNTSKKNLKDNNKKKHIKEKRNKKTIKLLIIIFLIIIFLSGLGIGGYYLYLDHVGESKYLKIELNGDKEITINYAEEYSDQGAKATYKGKDISSIIIVNNNLDLEHIGSYEYTYTIKYKKQSKKTSRVVNIIDKENPVIELNGKKEISLYVGDTYKEEGAKATDNYDKDLTDKIAITGEVDTKKKGEYKLTYTVTDSSDNSSSIERVVKVNEKPKPVVKTQTTTQSGGAQKVAVLNYHFFYASSSEGCDESICLNITKFKEQLKWLKDNGYKTLTMKEFVSWMYGSGSVPQKSVLITIDDGACGTGKHNGNHLIPALEEYQSHATLFLITGWWNINNYRSSYLDIQSHTNNLHTQEKCGSYRSKVNCVGYDALLEDLNKSISITNSKEAFCFPFYESSNESIRAVKDAGFKVAFVGGNRKASRNDNKYKIPRYVIYKGTTLEQFKNMVQ